MSKRSSDLLLLDMMEAAIKILKYTQGLTFEDFLADDKTIDAVVRNFEIIGNNNFLDVGGDGPSLQPHVV